MHIPDGFVSVGTAAVAYAASAGAIAYSARRAEHDLQERQVPFMGVMAAFVFAAQMINFKVAAGTSGHLLGGALLAILLGPWSATLVLTAVLAVQALIFQDGGLLALGANLLNMAVIGVWAGHGVFTLLRRLIAGRHSLKTAAFVSAWASVVVASSVCAVELAISGTAPLGVVLPAMTGVHALIGVGEGLITTAAVTLVAATRADLLPQRARPQGVTGGASS